MRRPAAPRPAFTLIEVVLAILLLLALVGGLYTFTDGLNTRSRLADRRATQMVAAEAVLDEIESALATTYVSGHDGAAGISGDAAHLNLRGRAWGYQADANDIGGCELKLDGAGLLARRITGGQPQTWESIAGVAGLRVRYHVGSEWKTSFDSAQAGSLPSAIEVSLWLGEPPEPAGDAPTSDSPAADATLRPADRVRVMAVHDAPPATGGAS